MDDWVAEELAKQTEDVPLREIVPTGSDLFHATKAIGDIEATKAILSLAEVKKRNGIAKAGFGHAGLVTADEHVSLTTSKVRGEAYFDILVAIAAIAENKATPDRWLQWYLARWGDTAKMLQEVATDFQSEISCAVAPSLEALGVQIALRKPTEIVADAVAALSSCGAVEQLAWLFDLDRALMQLAADPDQDLDPDQGLGVVMPNAQAWSEIRLRDVCADKSATFG